MNKSPTTSEVISQEKRDELAKAWSRMIDCISHDLMSPLVGLRATGENLEKIFPNLIKTYHLALEHKLEVPEINARVLKVLEEHLVPDIKQEISNIINFLNLLHPYDNKMFSDSEDVKLLSIKTCLDALLKKYPFATDKERALVHLDCKDDFKFKAANLFIDNLLNNLLSNALAAIARADKGEIHIWTSKDDDYNTLHFKDTALGTDKDALDKIFNRFFSKRNNEIIPGLGFCRLALLQAGGNVTCNSAKGEYTEFVIKFPSPN